MATVESKVSEEVHTKPSNNDASVNSNNHSMSPSSTSVNVTLGSAIKQPPTAVIADIIIPPVSHNTIDELKRKNEVLTKNAQLLHASVEHIISVMATAHKSSDSDDVRNFIEQYCIGACNGVNNAVGQLFGGISSYVNSATAAYGILQEAVTQSEEEAKESIEDLLSYIRAFGGESEELKCRNRLEGELACVSNASASSIFKKLRPFMQRANLQVDLIVQQAERQKRLNKLNVSDAHSTVEISARPDSNSARKRSWDDLMKDQEISINNINPHKVIKTTDAITNAGVVSESKQHRIRNSLLGAKAPVKSFFDSYSSPDLLQLHRPTNNSIDPVQKVNTDIFNSMTSRALQSNASSVNLSACPTDIITFANAKTVDSSTKKMGTMATLLQNTSASVKPLMGVYSDTS